MARTEYLLVIITLQDNGLLCCRHRLSVTHQFRWRIADSIADAVVLRARVVFRPREIVESVAIEHVGALVEVVACLVLTRQNHSGFSLETRHIVVQLGTDNGAIAPIQIVLARLGVLENVRVYCRPAILHDWHILRTKRFTQSILERTCRLITDSHTNLSFSHEIVVVLVFRLLAFTYFALNDTWSPRLTMCPLAIGLQVKDNTLVLPFLQVCT